MSVFSSPAGGAAMDRLCEAVSLRGAVCVGLDTVPEYVPPAERGRASSDAEAVLAYNKALVDATADTAACYKVQIACYEEMGLEGLRVYAQTLRYIRSKGLLVIADIKRGDIADTARRYARAHFEGEFEADFVTLSPYMGMDTLEPWLAYAEKSGKGAFVLMRTSNPGMQDFENQKLQDGRHLYEAVGDKLAELAATHHGARGYGLFGAVVGCTEAGGGCAAALRARYPSLFFLVPGYGAQGGAAETAAALLRNSAGIGGIVNASRSILLAWKTAGADGDFAAAASLSREAALQMRREIESIALSSQRE
ncbi:MAG: orotidine-5'-phosphate decarboxylase [Spirochaetaceae bacterium]|jgi:orotidine-5'-phosphate decarboxylase|nr:orotidine-5'-phosphate decarboxylase [Spirochaetaceae bacterium]